jgi:uncharacterized protein (DUF2147 family)
MRAMWILLWSISLSLAQGIQGIWWTENQQGKVQIYEHQGKFFGKIVWIKEPLKNGKPVTDAYNPNPKLRQQPVQGLVILHNLSLSSANLYENGTIYDPNNGKSYSLKITQKDKNTLELRGFLGISLLGRSQTWTRAQ